MKSRHILTGLVVVIVLLVFQLLPTACHRTSSYGGSQQQAKRLATRPPVPNFNVSASQLQQQCNTAINEFASEVDKIRTIPAAERNFASVVVRLDRVIADFFRNVGPLELLSDVSTEKELREAARICEQDEEKKMIDIFSDPRLAAAVVQAKPSAVATELDQQRLYDKFVRGFEASGATLPDKQRQRYVALLKRSSEIGLQFQVNIAEDNSHFEVAKGEMQKLQGLSETFIDKHKTAAGDYRFPVKTPQFIEFLTWADNAETRKAMMLLYSQKAADKNTTIFSQVMQLRHEMAQIRAGHRRPHALKTHEPVSHADYVLEGRLAGSSKRVFRFLEDLRAQLEPALAQERRRLLDLKRMEAKIDPIVLTKEEQEVFNKDGTLKLMPWDRRYYSRKWKERQLKIDISQVKQYFPMESVVQGTLQIYQELLGLRFNKVDLKQFPDATWHADVSLYEVQDGKRDQVLGYFYLDPFPRPNKFTHYAVFGLVRGGIDATEKRRVPTCAIIGNFRDFNTHNEVDTFFHEFGHVMQTVLYQGRYFELGRSPRDFIEAPSQMMEHWVWREEGLRRVASKPLPKKLLQGLVRSRNVDQGASMWTGQLLYAFADMTYHTQPVAKDFDPAKVWRQLYRKIVKLDFFLGMERFVNFSHIIRGYDAAYYGYLWSKVYADDMFSRFASEGIFNSKVGMEYRRSVLEPGNAVHADQAVEKFLGRPVNNRAFLASLGIAP